MKTASDKRHILLQHGRTRMFYVRNGDWTSDPMRARDFVTAQAAIAYSHAHSLRDAHLVVHFDRPDLHDLVLPLSPEQTPRPVTLAAA